MKSLLGRLKNGRVLISDGAWGTLLIEKGLQPGECPELWNITNRMDVYAVAKSYIDAGADMILTNSFGGSPVKLSHYELENRAEELNEAAAAISREAAGENHFVLGSIGPTGVILMMGEVSEQKLFEGFCIQAEALKKGGVDAICVETMSALDEACLAVRAAKTVTNLEVVCTFTFEKTINGTFRTMMGLSPGDMVNAVKNAGASIIGANCGNGFDQMIEIVKEIRNVDSSIPVLVHANAGKPIILNGKTIFPETPKIMADKARELVNSGANIIGGCCGTTPAHIHALVIALKDKR
ncbi:MAG: homocysteine S-methyltransferase family protein [Ignavibacteriaceae bacterium]|jgi:5-methyltetrahydrofolate--homocysteine methyltransferase